MKSHEDQVRMESFAKHEDVVVRLAYAQIFEQLADIDNADVEETLLGGIVAWPSEEAMAAATLLSSLQRGDEEASVNLVVRLQQLIAVVEDLPHLQMVFEQVCLAAVHAMWRMGEMAEFGLLGLVNEEQLPDLVRAKAGYYLARGSLPTLGWPEILERIANESEDRRARITATIVLEDIRALEKLI